MLLQDAPDQDCKEKKPGLSILLMEQVVGGRGRGWSWQIVQGGHSRGKLRARVSGRKKGGTMGMHLGTGDLVPRMRWQAGYHRMAERHRPYAVEEGQGF